MKQKTLFSFLTKENEILLDSPEVLKFTNNFMHENTYESDQKLISLLYHSPDVQTVKLVSDKENDSVIKRYYLDTTLCYTCGQIGHTERKCRRNLDPFCVLCTGAHTKSSCPMKVCNKCNLLGHTFKECKEESDPKRFKKCVYCVNEHTESDCPIWRQYIFKDDTFVKPLSIKGCTNCGSNNHFVDDCRTKKSKFSIFTSDYKNVSNFFKK